MLSSWRPEGQSLPHKTRWNCKATTIWFCFLPASEDASSQDLRSDQYRNKWSYYKQPRKTTSSIYGSTSYGSIKNLVLPPIHDEANKHNPKHTQQPGEQLYVRVSFDWLSSCRHGGQRLPHTIRWNCKATTIWFRNWIDKFGSAFSQHRRMIALVCRHHHRSKCNDCRICGATRS